MAYQTPYFVIDENQLTKDFQMLKSSLETSWGNYRIGYSFKTNSLPWLVTFLKAGGVMAEVVSDDEYSLAGALGFSNSEIVYNGPVKKRPSFERVLLAGGILNMDGRHRRFGSESGSILIWKKCVRGRQRWAKPEADLDSAMKTGHSQPF